MDDGSVTDSLLSAEIVGCLSLGWATLSVVASQTTRFNVSLFVPDQWNVAVDSILKAHSRRFLQDPFLRSLNSSPRLILLSSLSLSVSRFPLWFFSSDGWRVGCDHNNNKTQKGGGDRTHPQTKQGNRKREWIRL